MGQTPQQGQQLNDNHLTLLTAPISLCCPGRRPLTPWESHAAAVLPGQGALFSSGGNRSQPLLCVVLHSRPEQLFNFILSIRG
ncbi:hypothetical protein QQF64_010935 [Cirrhinus molitorella]|uniref:Uncharacterized protein n=1 Tax=Cirrhinus molitorella TaxID=172907 RepID=A0ABR3LXT9_9TELE